MNKCIAALCLLSFIFVSIPDPARGYEWGETAAEQRCEKIFDIYRSTVEEIGKIIDLDNDMIKLIADGIEKLPKEDQPTNDYVKALRLFKTGYFVKPYHNPKKVILYVGVSDPVACDGVIVTIPLRIYYKILETVGKPA